MSRSRSDAWYRACRDSVVMGSVVSLRFTGSEPYWVHLAGGALMVIVTLLPYLHYLGRRG